VLVLHRPNIKSPSESTEGLLKIISFLKY